MLRHLKVKILVPSLPVVTLRLFRVDHRFLVLISLLVNRHLQGYVLVVTLVIAMKICLVFAGE